MGLGTSRLAILFWEGPAIHTNGTLEIHQEFQALEAKIKAVLPAQYHECLEDLNPVSMGSAALEFGPDGKVAWDKIWTSFCKLALAGGPPHRGTLLEPAAAADVAAEPEKYQQVVAEIGRGIWMVTQLPVLLHVAPGWVGVRCQDEGMAAWLLRAIVVENVMARHKKNILHLPAGPHFQVDKEIKNVVTAVAKTNHYWTEHMTASQQASAAVVFCPALSGVALLEPACIEEATSATRQLHEQNNGDQQSVQQATALPIVPTNYPNWIGFKCQDEGMAIWLMRAIMVSNILVRREGDVLFLPNNPKFLSGDHEKIGATIASASRLWSHRRS